MSSTRTIWNEVREQPYPKQGLGFADYFSERMKRKMFDLAALRPRDVFYDLGSGDASVLIFAVKEYHVRKAVGFENNPSRNALAKRRVSDAGLSHTISIRGDIRDADLDKANVILSMLSESEEDYEEVFKDNIRPGTRLIKHDLPLLGFNYDKVDYPFYLTRFPLRRMRSPEAWASRVMERPVRSVQELWQELFYYQEKGYAKSDVKRFEKILKSRIPRKQGR